MAVVHGVERAVNLLARKFGTSEDGVRLSLAILAGLPLAFIYRTSCYRKNSTVQHAFITVCGLSMAFFCFGWSCLHSLLNITLAYFVLRLGGPQVGTVIVMFVLNVGYLLLGYSLKSKYSQDYSITWTTAHCVLCLRLTGLSWDYYDGNQDQETLYEDLKATAIRNCPSLLQIASYTYFFGGFLVGPQFPIKKYLALIDGSLIDKKDDLSGSRISAGLKRFCIGLLYLVSFSLLVPKVKGSFLITDEFVQKTFLYKLCYVVLWIRVTLMKYQAVWLIAEGSCIISGLGYNGHTADGHIRWDGCSNVQLVLFDTAYTFQQVIDAFNLTTNQWMFRYLYRRLRFLGSKMASHLITLVFVALWHGLAPGFFLCFIGEFVVIVVEQQVLGFCRRVIHKPFTSFPLLIKIPIILLGICLRLVGVSFFLVPFFLRRLDHTHTVWLSLYYIAPLVLLGVCVVHLTILSPLSRSIIRNPQDSNQNKIKESKQE